MANERMVTRTISEVSAEVMCIDTETADVSIKTYKIGGGITDPATILKVLKKTHETATYKLVTVQTVTVNEVLYGMTEQDFIAHAKVLPPRGTKAE